MFPFVIVSTILICIVFDIRKREASINWLWVSITAVLHVADLLLTLKGLSLGFHEGNPLAVYLIGKFGTLPALVFMKLTVIPWLYFYGDRPGLLKGLALVAFWFAILPWCYAIFWLGHP